MSDTPADHALPVLPASPVCPQCGRTTHRIPRLNQDRAHTASIRARRYRCGAVTCGWQGLLLPADLAPAVDGAGSATSAATPPAGKRPLRWARNAVLGSTVVAAIGFPVVVAAVVGLGAVAGPPGAVALAPGVSHDGLALRGPSRPSHPAPPSQPQGGQLLPAQAAGEPAFTATAAAAVALSAAAATATGPLTLRQGCAWGQPGRNPYRGSTEQALQAARLPEDVVRQVSAMRLAKQTTARLQISTAGIREVDGPREFAPRGLALTFGNTLCMDSKVNFAPGHTEPADLYEVRDSQGRLHAVMVPDVCGNVSVLQRRGQRGVVAGLAGALAQRSVAMAALADALAQDGAGAAETTDAAPGGDGGEGGASATNTDTDSAAAETAAARPGVAPAAGATPGRAAAVGAGAETAGAPAVPAGAGQSSQSGPADAAAPATTGTSRAAERSTLPAAPAGLTVATLAGLTDLVLPRSVAVAGLGSLASGLAQAAEAASSVAVVLGDTTAPLPVTGLLPSTERQAVPEPGTLACVLAGLVALLLVRRRQG